MECEPVESPNRPKTRIPLKIEENLAGIILGALTVITFANVLVRYLTDFSFAFTEEFSIFLMVAMTLLGSSSLMAKGGHLNITFFVDRLPEKHQRWVRAVSMGLAGVTFLILAVLGAAMAWDEYRYEVTSPGLGVPTWIYTVWLPVLSLVIAGRCAGAIARKWKGVDR